MAILDPLSGAHRSCLASQLGVRKLALFIVWPVAHIFGAIPAPDSTLRLWVLSVPIVMTIAAGAKLVVCVIRRLLGRAEIDTRGIAVKAIALLLLLSGPKFVSYIENRPVEAVVNALGLFRSQTGRLPDRLDLMVPTFIDRIPDGRVILQGCRIEYRLLGSQSAEIWVDDPTGRSRCTSLVLSGPRRLRVGSIGVPPPVQD